MIRQAKKEDAARMAEIHIFGWRSAYRGIVDDDYLFAKLSVAKRIIKFEKAIEEGKENNLVFEEDGIIKAFMTIGKCRNDDKKEAYELWGIYVEPLMKRNGIGRTMINYCEDIARENGHKENVLWVLKDNIASRAFYEKMGYIADGKEEYLDHIKAIEIRYCKKI
jgi:GNAT superfamily N-acetyltransferase